MFNGYLQSKLMKNIESVDFLPSKFNCNKASKVDGKCYYGEGQRRKYCIIYKVKCKICAAEYIGNTQNHLKTRFACHYSEVRKLVRMGRK